ncbi:MAG: UTP--glucose-1-phosphate uridylyltransferase, partial [Pseudophaeobacter sp.]
AVIGRYILGPSVLRNLNQMKQGAGGEIQLTDAIAEDIAAAVPTHGFRFQGERYDCGSKAGFLQATVAFALSRPELREDLMGYISKVAQVDKAAE